MRVCAKIGARSERREERSDEALRIPRQGAARSEPTSWQRRAHLEIRRITATRFNQTHHCRFLIANTAVLMSWTPPSSLAPIFSHFTCRSWRLTRFATEEMGAEPMNAAVATLALYLTTISVFCRLMQGSAETTGQSIAYEVGGTISELFFADAFLKGITPVQDTLYYIRKVLGNSDPNPKVSPEEGECDGDSPMPRQTSSTSLQHVFCSTAMVMLTVTEATALLSSSYFWLLMSASPRPPGSPAIPVSQR